MSVHSTHYDNQEEYERDLKYEYRKEQYEQDHGIIEDLPFYTDDPDDPHWRCENCGHCKDIAIAKRVIKTHPEMWHDTNHIQHVNSSVCVTYVQRDRTEFEPICVCELLEREVLEDDTCEAFIEKGEQ